ncbi:hypothetical protein E2C01_015177 [Portunus trituberculatus]|uniref:Uncharacterized protein n=1 Tax=Portunus trituberculatus TaxID=210409 RepID=A0A5B7DKZ6_PORTR|nr:hypothetical protein [Portunus trituberculatus]
MASLSPGWRTEVDDGRYSFESGVKLERTVHAKLNHPSTPSYRPPSSLSPLWPYSCRSSHFSNPVTSSYSSPPALDLAL